MKVFNWVHRRFSNVHSCTAFLQENGEEKDVTSKKQIEKHIFLEHDAHVVVDMLDHWEDGILAIGTLAISPLETSTFGHTEELDNGHDQEIINHHDAMYNYDIKDDDHDEARLLMNVEFFSHELEQVIGANHEITEVYEVVEDVVGDLKDKNGDVMTEDNEVETKRRVTLADLFLEDSDYHPVKILKELDYDNDDDNDDVNVKDDIITEKQGPKMMMMMKPPSRAKNGLSKAKKLLKEDLRPLKKFNQLMKRMMKKKIHPDFERKIQKDMEMQPSNGLSNPTNELASMLLIQDAMA